MDIGKELRVIDVEEPEGQPAEIEIEAVSVGEDAAEPPPKQV